MRRKDGGKRQRRKKARAAEQASGSQQECAFVPEHSRQLTPARSCAVAADGTSAPAPHELRSTPSLQKPGSRTLRTNLLSQQLGSLTF